MGSDKETRVLEAAATVFFRYGYRKTTMGDIATAAGISRPALYLLFCNKERIFESVLRRWSSQLLDTIQKETEALADPTEKLRRAFDLWTVQPFELMTGSPDARDLVQCGFEFAGETIERNYAGFESLLASILVSFPGKGPEDGSGAGKVAHLLAVSARGFKGAARDVAELRGLLDGLLAMAVTSWTGGFTNS